RDDESMRAAFWKTVDERKASFQKILTGLGSLDLPPNVAGTIEWAKKAEATLTENKEQNGDWFDAPRLLRVYEDQIQHFVTAALEEAKRCVAGFAERFAAKKSERPPGRELVKASAEFSGMRKDIETSVTSHDAVKALQSCQKADEWLKKFEALQPLSDEEKEKTVNGAADDVKSKSDDGIAKMPLKDRAQLAFNLCAQGVPKGEGKEP